MTSCFYTITYLLGLLFIFLGSSIIRTYIKRFQSQCFILSIKCIIWLQLFLFSISLIYIIIYSFFTSILLTVLNSNFWSGFILIYHFYDSNYDIISEIQIVIIIFFPFSLFPLSFYSRRDFFSIAVAPYNQCRCLLLFYVGFS